MQGHDIIVIGASAGGVEALRELVRELPQDLPASIFVVLHMSNQNGGTMLPSILDRAGTLPAHAAMNGTRFERGHIYVAPPDFHLLIEGDHIRVVRGPKENRHRPSVDPLFRSAAWAYGPRVVGVVLSGTLDDGAAGLWAIKTCGGVTVVQDPAEAAFSGMPTSPLMTVRVDYRLSLDRIVMLLDELARRPVKDPSFERGPENLHIETKFASLEKGMGDMDNLGDPSVFTCPACQGALWELKDGDMLRYRCHTGHAFSADTLLAEQTEAAENAIYSALQALEEKARALRRVAERFEERFPDLETRYRHEAGELDESAAIIRHLLASRRL